MTRLQNIIDTDYVERLKNAYCSNEKQKNAAIKEFKKELSEKYKDVDIDTLKLMNITYRNAKHLSFIDPFSFILLFSKITDYFWIKMLSIPGVSIIIWLYFLGFKYSIIVVSVVLYISLFFLTIIVFKNADKRSIKKRIIYFGLYLVFIWIITSYIYNSIYLWIISDPELTQKVDIFWRSLPFWFRNLFY